MHNWFPRFPKPDPYEEATADREVIEHRLFNERIYAMQIEQQLILMEKIQSGNRA